MPIDMPRNPQFMDDPNIMSDGRRGERREDAKKASYGIR
jgi:hypothetical protein